MQLSQYKSHYLEMQSIQSVRISRWCLCSSLVPLTCMKKYLHEIFNSLTMTKFVCIFVSFSVNTDQTIGYRTRLVIQIQANVVGWWGRRGHKRQHALNNYSIMWVANGFLKRNLGSMCGNSPYWWKDFGLS